MSLFQEAQLPTQKPQPGIIIGPPRLSPARVVQPTAVIGSNTSQHVMPKTMPKRKKAANHKGGWPGDPSTRQGQGHWPTTEAESSSVQLLKLAQTRVLPPAPPPPPKHGVTVKRLRVSHTPSVSIRSNACAFFSSGASNEPESPRKVASSSVAGLGSRIPCLTIGADAASQLSHVVW
jgi:hypothetical protein